MVHLRRSFDVQSGGKSLHDVVVNQPTGSLSVLSAKLLCVIGCTAGVSHGYQSIHS